MFPPSTYTATCRRDGPAWLVHVRELDRTARAARLSQVEGVARSLVATFTSEEAASCRVVVELDVRHGLSELVDAAAAVRADPDRVSVEAVTLRRCLARRLAAEGLDVRDVAALLGLSYGRALQLVGEFASPRALASASATTASWSTAVSRLPAPRLAADDDQGAVASGGRPRPHRSYRHEAYLYRGEQDFLDTTLPFLREGVALGQAVMVAVRAAQLEALRAALGPAEQDVYWVDMAELGAAPARIVPAWQAFVDEHGVGGRPTRGVGEPVWAQRRPEELVECQLHEALLNLAVEPDTPLWLRCPYDAEALPAAVLEEAARSHPALVDGEDFRGSTSYGGVDHAQTLFADDLPEPVGPVEEQWFGETDLERVRHAVRERAAAAGLGHGRTADLVLAITEAATNSIRHGGGEGRLRTWEQSNALVCEVSDRGHVEDPLAGRRAPSLTAESGRGLWLVHQLTDLAQVRSGSAGTTVRVLSWR